MKTFPKRTLKVPCIFNSKMEGRIFSLLNNVNSLCPNRGEKAKQRKAKQTSKETNKKLVPIKFAFTEPCFSEAAVGPLHHGVLSRNRICVQSSAPRMQHFLLKKKKTKEN